MECGSSNTTDSIKSARQDTFTLDRAFILTQGKKLVTGMPYLYLEGSHIEAVKLLDVWDTNNYVFVKIIGLKTGKINTLSWTLDYSGTYWLWSLSSYDYLQKLAVEKGEHINHTSPSFHNT